MIKKEEIPMIKNQLTWKIGGEAGYGIMSAGQIFGKICSRGGLNIVSTTDYPSRIRGGHNTFVVRVSEDDIHSLKAKVDLLVALNQETVDRHKEELEGNGAIIYDGEEFPLEAKDFPAGVALVNVPFTRMAQEMGEAKVVMNTVAIGASIALLKYDFSIFEKLLTDMFRSKGEKVVQNNITAAKVGYDHVQQNFKGNFDFILEKRSDPPKMLMTGNDALSFGALKAGMKFYAAYPMTPASSILHFMAAREQEFSLVVKQTEDEIAAINMAIGASYAGVRAMCGTSGGGFALMCEALGLAAMTETPLVVIESQRSGPSTSMATQSEQGDLQFVIHSSQGEFPRVVMAPGNFEQAFECAQTAFNLAEKYQIPVLIMLDKYFSESYLTGAPFPSKLIPIDRGKILSEKDLASVKEYKRYEITPDGISPRTLPGTPGGLSVTTGNEHYENGTTTENKQNRNKMVEKRFKKLENLQKETRGHYLYGDPEADVTLVGWGSTQGVILDILEGLKKENIRANFLQFYTLYPFPAEETQKLLKKARIIIDIENNYTSQLASLIREHTGIEIKNKIVKYDGRPFFLEETYAKVKELIGAKELAGRRG